MAFFSDLLKAGQSVLTQKSKKSVNWLKNLIDAALGNKKAKIIDIPVKTPSQKIVIPPPSQKSDNQDDVYRTSIPEVGSMYFFMYHDPKYKKTLPYYDLFPLVICIEHVSLVDGPGFMGLNLHYLKPGARAVLMDALDSIKNNDKYDQTTKLNVSYQVLKNFATKFSGYENCLKMYYFERVKGQSFYYIKPSDWAYVVTLPLQQWIVNPNKRYAGTPPY